jgi:hypothetical protein
MITNLNRIKTKFILLQTYYFHFDIQGVSGGIYIQGVSGGILNILRSGSMDYFE